MSIWMTNAASSLMGGVGELNGEPLIGPQPATVEMQSDIGNVLVRAAGSLSDYELQLDSPAEIAGRYRVDFARLSGGAVNIVPPRLDGVAAYRRKLCYRPGLWLNRTDGPAATVTWTGAQDVQQGACVVRAEDRGKTLAVSETHMRSDGPVTLTASRSIPFVQGLDDDAGIVLRYDRTGITDSGWLSYHADGDDLSQPGRFSSLPGFLDNDRLSLTREQSVGFTDRSIVSPVLAAQKEIHMFLVIRPETGLADGLYHIFSEVARTGWTARFEIFVQVSGGAAKLQAQNRLKSGQYAFGVSAPITLGSTQLVELHVTTTQADLIINGVSAGDDRRIYNTDFYDGSSGGNCLIGKNKPDWNERPGFVGDIMHVHASTAAPAQVRPYLSAQYGIEL